MPPFKEEHILIIHPGSATTLVRLGLPESFAPAPKRFPTRMFPGERPGKWEAYRVRAKDERDLQQQAPATILRSEPTTIAISPSWIADLDSSEGAVYPIQQGRLVDSSCLCAFLEYIHAYFGPPLHTPILIVTPPAFTQFDLELLTSFCFEKFRAPAFSVIDAGVASLYGFGLATGVIVDVGYEKTDALAVIDFVPSQSHQAISVPGLGGHQITQHLHALLHDKGWTYQMCEQLKKSPICEVLPFGVSYPGTQEETETPRARPPTSGPLSAGAGAAPAQRLPIPAATATGLETAPAQDEPEDGVLDIAQIVGTGKTSEFLAKKEKEKAEKAARKAGASAEQVKARLPNSKRPRNSFWYEPTYEDIREQDAQQAKRQKLAVINGQSESSTNVSDQASGQHSPAEELRPAMQRRELEVGHERFQALPPDFIDSVAAVIYHTISAIEDINQRHMLWDHLIITGNGSRVRGFKEALVATLNQKYLIHSATASSGNSLSGYSGLPSETPSRFASPIATGANTPLPGPPGGLPSGAGSGVNPLLLAATSASNAARAHLGSNLNPLTPPSRNTPQPPTYPPAIQHPAVAASNVQSATVRQHPVSIKTPKLPDYFPEWKEAGESEISFLGAQVAAKVGFVTEAGAGGGGRAYVSRIDYNEGGPGVIHEVGF